MLIVLDDVLDEANRVAVRDYFASSAEARKFSWADGSLDVLCGYGSPMSNLLNVARKYFDLSGMAGCEYWAHYGTRPDWHIDKDEELYKISGNLSCPICSIVYYADIDVAGGEFMTETITVAPVTNRMLIFSPGLMHGVAKFEGTRLSVAVNPWVNKPLGFA